MEFILYILFLRNETGMAIDSQVYADERSCEAAKQIVLDEYEQGRQQVSQFRSTLRTFCVPAGVETDEAAVADE